MSNVPLTSLGQLLNASHQPITIHNVVQTNPGHVSYLTDPSPDCEAKFNYSMQQVLMVLVQKSTGHKTHEIFNNIAAELEKIRQEFDVDFKSKTLTKKWDYLYRDKTHKQWVFKRAANIKKLVCYPGTDIKFFIAVKVHYIANKSRWGNHIHGKYIDEKDIAENCNYVEVSIYVPQKRITFTDETMQAVLAEGDLLDMSEDIQEPTIKESKARGRKKKTTTDSNS